MSEQLYKALYPMIEGQAENFVRILQNHIRSLEEALKEGESLCVYCNDGTQCILVKEFRFQSWNFGILSGCDENNNPTQLVTHINGVQVTCQVIKSTTKKPRIGFFVPKNEADKESA